MKPPLRVPFPGGIAGQLAALLVVSLLVIHVVAFSLFTLLKGERPPQPPEALLHKQIAVVWLLNRAKPAERAELVRAALKDDPQLALELLAASPPGLDWSGRDLPPPLRDGLGAGMAATLQPAAVSDAATGAVLFRLGDGALVRAPMSVSSPPFFAGPVLVTLVFLAVSLLVLGLWAVRNLIAPLRRFAQAVERFGSGGVEPVALAEQGPDELRRAARAFNNMQTRINRLVSDRTRMLVAVGHDLRTPVTRLRLRTDFIKDAELRDAVLSDLDHMDALLQGAMSYLREGRSGEKNAVLDLPSLIQSIVDQWSDAGVAIGWEGPSRLSISGRPSEVMRLFSNLADNAVNHGGDCRIALSSGAGHARVAVIDHGPGIAGDQKAAMLEPFARGDAARNMDAASGLGLGLAICQAIVKGHDGLLELDDTPGGGLTVRVALPLAE